MSKTFRTKRKILGLIKKRAMTLNDLSNELKLSKATMSQHLEELQNSGDVEKIYDEHFRNMVYFKLLSNANEVLSEVHKRMHLEMHEKTYRLFERFRDQMEADPKHMQKEFSELKSFLYRHIKWEEERLFVTLAAKSKEVTLIGGFKEQHARLKDLLTSLNINSRAQDAASEAADYEQENLGELLKAHDGLEEKLLFPLVKKYLDNEELDNLLAEMLED